MKLFLRRNAPLFYALGAMLVLYIPWLNRGYLNWEWPHVLAGEALAYPEKIELLDAYWSTGQANPLGYPLFNALLQRLVPWTDAPWLWRVPSLIGCGLIITWGWLVREEFGKNALSGFNTWAFLIITSPMIVAFSTHASSDVLPVGLVLISFWFLSQFAKTENFYQLMFSAALFGLASITKYIVVYLSGYVIFVLLNYRAGVNKRLFSLATFGSIWLFIIVLEIGWKQLTFDVFVSTKLSMTRPDFWNISKWFIVLLKYLSFVGLFCGLLPACLAWAKARSVKFRLKHFFLSIASVVLAIASSLPVKGELNFGGGHGFPQPLINLIIFIGFVNFGLLIPNFVYLNDTSTIFRFAWLAGLVPFIVLMSASRPTQRYIILLIPIVLFFLVQELSKTKVFFRRVGVLLTVVLFVCVSIWGMSFLTSQGNTSESIAVWVKENNLLSQTSAGAIKYHAGQHWWGIEAGVTRYEIIAVTPSEEAQVKERILHREPMKVLGKVTRVYLLREIPSTP